MPVLRVFPRDLRTRLSGLLLFVSLPVAALDIANLPMVLPTPALPNVVLTLKTPMKSQDATPPFMGEAASLATASYQISPIAYNPYYTYREPPGYENKTAFSKARRYGYLPNSNNVYLSCQGATSCGAIGSGGASITTNETNLNHHFCHVDRIQAWGSMPNEILRSSTCDGGGAYYTEFDSSKTTGTGAPCNFSAHALDPSCYKKIYVKTLSEEQKKNFAIWYSFYRTRELATRSSLLVAMPKFEGKVRLAWQGDLSNASDSCVVSPEVKCTTGGVPADGYAPAKPIDNRLRLFTGEHAQRFYAWIKSNPQYEANTNIAMMRAAEYLGKSENYRDDPQDTTSALRSCRDNIHLVVGDVYAETSYKHIPSGTLPNAGEIDSAGFTKGTSTGTGKTWAIDYTPKPPYMDRPKSGEPVPEKLGMSENPCVSTSGCENKNSLADLAMYYWATDLAPSLPDTLVPSISDTSGSEVARTWNPRNNPARWQNLMQFMVITGAQAQFLSQHGSDWVSNMYDGKPAKGEKNWHKYDNAYSLAYDHWHAALNSRGVFYPVDRVDEIIDAIDKIANRIEKRLAASAAISANSTRLDTGTVLYQARYTAVDWTGELIASKLDASGAAGTTQWTASIPPASDRKLVTHNGSVAVDFDSTALLPSDWATQVGVAGATAVEVLAWLRGDQSQEQSFDADGNLLAGKYRKRANVLGDIVNSDPVYVGHQDYGYAPLPEAASDAYKNFVTANKSRVKMLYVGANDGMLHGFVADSGTGPGNACGGVQGRELFAYIPRSARERMPTLANPEYGRPGGIPHRYLVDGSPSVGDAFIDGAWRTILLGTTGAGGRSIFALDVTNPCDFAPSKVLWERDETWDADIGYTLAKPIIARLNNGKWAAVFGNGYNSASGHAVLFVVDLANGSLIKKFDLGGSDNGTAAPSLYDADGNGTTDYIYAGDLQGRLWKIDVSGVSEHSWTVAVGGAPLFTAIGPDGKAQPITAAPELGTPPTGVSGVMVYFGTGRFFIMGDEVNHNVQSLYGLLDKGNVIADRADLVAQSIVEEQTSGGKSVRKVTTNTVDYATKSGWYLDLNFGGAKGERVISTPRRVFSRVFFTTLVPESDPCLFGGTSWLIELEPTTGGMPENNVIDLGSSEVIAGVMSSVGIVKSFDFLSGEGAVAIGLGSTGATESIRLNPPSLSPRTGRVSWREIIE